MTRTKKIAGRHGLWLGVYFTAGDCLSSAGVGALTALVVKLLVSPRWDVAIAMLAGMGVGSAVHLVLGVVVAPLFGGIEAMTSAGLAGMYGGMFFAMRDAMMDEPVLLGRAVWVGALFGFVVWAGVAAYNRISKGVVFEAESAGPGGKR